MKRAVQILIGALAVLLVSLVAIDSATASAKERVLYAFPGGSRGQTPIAGVTFDKSGNMYGTTFSGGIYGWGTVYQLQHKKRGWREVVLHSFQGGTDGANPTAGVVVDETGNIYGTTSNNVAFELTQVQGTWTYAVIHQFGSNGDGSGPYGLIENSAGILYGTTVSGGRTSSHCPNGCGTVFELKRSHGSWREIVLFSFADDPVGASPSSPPIFDKKGNLYGELGSGGSNKQGSIFELKRLNSTWKEIELFSFSGNLTFGPAGGLAFDRAGNLYGTSQQSGSDRAGNVFRLVHSRSGWTEENLHTFSVSDGLYPIGGVAINDLGNVYGTTAEGGANTLGVIFKLEHTSWTDITLYNFVGGKQGDDPQDGLVFGPDGNLYGTATSELSRIYAGTVFVVRP